MLSLFPSLLAFEQIAPFLLRVTLAIVFLFWAYRKLRVGGSTVGMLYAILEALIGISLIFGFYMQLGALIAAIILGIRLLRKIGSKSFFTDGVNYYFLLFVIALSLLFLGAGAFAFDMPL